MVKVDLITGFLGSGKTTFIRKYANYLQRKGLKIVIIENEFGGVSVDYQALQDQGCDITQINGGCMCCTGKIAFQNLLLDSAAKGYDRILVEPSGIYDVDEFFDLLLTEPVNSSCEIGNIITIADANFDDSLSDEARYLMFSQLLSAGALVLSKTQLYPRETSENSLNRLQELLKVYGSKRDFQKDSVLYMKNWEELSDTDFEKLLSCGYLIQEHDRELIEHGSVFTGRILAGLCKNAEDLKNRIEKVMKDSKHGKIFRIKGHIADTNKNWYEINATPDGIFINPADIKRGLFIVIGQDMDETALQEAFISRR